MSPETTGMLIAFVIIGGIFIAMFVLSIDIARRERKNQEDADRNKQDEKDE